jgi:hypothetical protein
MTRLVSNASVFENMGNPWVSEREAQKERGETKTVLSALSPSHRKLALINNRLNTRLAKLGKLAKPQMPFTRGETEVFIEDPELDQFTKATRAPKHKEMAPMKGKPLSVTTARRAACISLELRMKLLSLEGRK